MRSVVNCNYVAAVLGVVGAVSMVVGCCSRRCRCVDCDVNSLIFLVIVIFVILSYCWWWCCHFRQCVNVQSVI